MSVESRDQLQTTIGDSYRIERELGGGGMSRVYFATETQLGRDVVIKVIAPELAGGFSAERFAREVKVAARLQQANIVPLLSAGDAGGLPYYTMPFVRGESLRARMAREGGVSATEAVSILRDVARALAYAHGEGVIHRDIKPENILLSGGTAVVTDFGIAKALSASRTIEGSPGAAGTLAGTITQLGVSIGTPAYMPPEQAAGDPGADHRADVYAWGVVAWELIAGRHPFVERTSAAALIAAHMSETPAPLATVRPDVAPALAALVARCLEKDPDRRPQSANELLATLDQLGTASGERDSVRARRRTPVRTVALAVAGVAIVAVGGWLGVRRSIADASAKTEKSLAVLPFESVGGDTANAYFAEGMADELTTALSKVTGLRVAATSSAFSYRNKTADVREVGRALNVGAVLQGRVRREGTKMRVSAQLTNAADGLLLWSNSYEREVKDVFAVQNDLTHDIVDALRMTFAAAARPSKGSAGADTTDVETYELYLRGRFFLTQRGGGVARSIGYFQRAIARDSNFARAWGELGVAYTVLPLSSPVPVDSVLALARVAIANANRLDPTNAAAMSAEGMAHMLALEWREATSSFERSIAVDSTYTLAQRAYTTALNVTGRTEEAVAQAKRATRLDPLAPYTHVVSATVLLSQERRAEALAMARSAIDLDTSVTSFGHLFYALAMHASGNVDSARSLLKGARSFPQSSAWLGYLLAATGDRAGAAAFIKELEAERGKNAFTNVAQAWTYLGGGDTTHALAALERALQAREPISFSVPFGMPAYDAIRHSQRFIAVIKGYGLDPATFRAALK